MRDIFDRLSKIGKGKKCGTRPNQYAADPVVLAFEKKDIAIFNRAYKALYDSDMHTITRTPSGAIESTRKNLYAWDVYINRCGLRLTAVLDGHIFVWRIGRPRFNESGMKGWKAWRIFLKLCAKHNIDLEKMAIENGAEVKEKIQKPLILMLRCHTELAGVHHIDFHSSYPSGLAITHPEFRPIIEELYQERKKTPSYKDVLNCIVGYMQSVGKCKARWAHLAKDAIDNNNTRVMALAFLLVSSGREIIGYNTDGIWYKGEVYHDPRNGEGPGIGNWHNDHIGCMFRAKSSGAYEFVENGRYKAVVRGFTKLDEVKPRSKWKWGDIYQTTADIIKYQFVEGLGIKIIEDDKKEPEKEAEDYEEDDVEEDREA